MTATAAGETARTRSRPSIGFRRLRTRVGAHRGVVRLVVLIIGAAALDVATHDVGYLAQWPLWGDEAWVVLSKLFPVTDLPALTSSTPIGLNLLVQAFAPFGVAGGRILVQLFVIAATVVAFYVGYHSPVRPKELSRDVAGAVVAFGVALFPTLLLRVDIKQYTADAFFTVLILLLLLLVLKNPFGRSLYVLTAVCFVGLLFSFAVLFAGATAFGCVILNALIRRRSLSRMVIAGAIAGAGITGLYVIFYARGNNAALHEFWAGWYPASLVALPRFLVAHFYVAAPYASFASIWLIVPFVAIAFVVLLVRREWAFAAFLPALLAFMCALGLLQLYPLLDPRTSTTFLTASSIMGICGALWLADTVVRAVLRHRSRGVRARVTPVVAGTVTVALLVCTSWVDLRAHPLPRYDTNYQAQYVESHAGPNDLVLYNNLAGYQLALSWTRDRPSWCATRETWTGFWICYPHDSQLEGFTTLAQAYRLINRQLTDHPGTRVWLIRSSVFVEYEQMERDLPQRYDYQVINLPIQPVGLVTGLRT